MRFIVPVGVAFLCSATLFGAILSESAPAFQTSYTKTMLPGDYHCAQCGALLFRSNDKFVSNTRWPSFRDCAPGNVATRRDRSEGLDRTEILCARCGAHLGHVFDDGPLAGDTAADARLRYCALSSALSFSPGKVEVVVPDEKSQGSGGDRSADSGGE